MDYYSPTGKRLSGVLEWAERFEDKGYFAVTHLDTNVGPVRVSTVWLGLDHSFQSYLPWEQDDRDILIFETMVFVPKVTWFHDWYSNRYTTIEQAVAGHWYWVRKARRWWPVWWVRACAYRVRRGRGWK